MGVLQKYTRLGKFARRCRRLINPIIRKMNFSHRGKLFFPDVSKASFFFKNFRITYHTCLNLHSEGITGRARFDIRRRLALRSSKSNK